MLLLECLKRRENWPEQLIEALEACEQQTIAAEIRAEYDALRGINSKLMYLLLFIIVDHKERKHLDIHYILRKLHLTSNCILQIKTWWLSVVFFLRAKRQSMIENR